MPRLHATSTVPRPGAGVTQVGEQPGVVEKRRATWKVRVSTSTTWSSIMHAEYRKSPEASKRAPWGMTQVSIRSTSTMPGA